MSNGGSGNGKVIAGVFIGMVLGIAAAGGIAWYLMHKGPTPFTNKEQLPKAAPQVTPLPASAPVAASGVGETKQHFEFYKVLTDKSDGSSRKNTDKAPAKPKEQTQVKPPITAPVAATSGEKFFVQAGSFQNLGDAEKQKAKLAFSGMEASIQTVTIPEKGVWHRVRLGPYSESEAGKTIATLKLNGISATQVHAQ